MQKPGTTIAAHKAWAEYERSLAPGEHLLKVGLAGTFTVEPLVPHIGAGLLAKGIKPVFEVGPYNQLPQLCHAPDAFFASGTPDVLCVFWRIEDLFPDALESALNDGGEAFQGLLRDVQRMIDAFRQLRQSFSGTLVIALPPYPYSPAFDVTDQLQAGSAALLYNRIQSLVLEGLGDIEEVSLLETNGLLAKLGADNCHDPSKWYLYRQPYTEKMLAALGRQAARIITSHIISPKKVVVLDCDNTLWGGIVGEDGLAGIDLGRDYPGSAFRDFQGQLLRLQKSGVLLAVASKNNPEDVDEVFESHDEMVLKKEHIATFEVHWRSKADSMRSIAEKLNLGIDSFVFIDDNPKEIAEVSSVHPDVTCLQVPEDTELITDMLRDCDLFDKAEVTEEDKKRSAMIRAELDRQEISTSISKDEFLQTLELKIEIFQAEEQHLARVVQLINKTNQFNLTTVRRTRPEVESIREDPNFRIYCIDVSDRFGSYGVVGVAVLQKHATDAWMIDTLLMSCRVLGREVETAFIQKLTEAVADAGGSVLMGNYIETRKNALVKELLPEHGFVYDESNECWKLHVEEAVQPSQYVTSVWR